MVPFYGQGMNAGFEDVLLLDKALVSSSMPGDHPDIETILTKFSNERIPNAHAICDLALYNYLEMRCLVNQSGFIYRRFLDYKLYKIFGRSWTPLYNNVTFSLTPYVECIEHKKWQDHVISKGRKVAWTTLSVLTCLAVLLKKASILNRLEHVTQHLSGHSSSIYSLFQNTISHSTSQNAI